MTHSLVIAIDGPCGSGKSTVAKQVAKNLSVLYVDTGAMFRALGYIIDKLGIAFEEGETLKKFLAEVKLSYGESDKVLVRINGEDLTQKIREHHVSALASSVSKLGSIRAFLLDFQRDLASKKVCVMEGRDIGTVVFPDAFCKIFVTADLKIRAQRRYDQLIAQGAKDVNFDTILADVKDRDDKDMNRPIAPLKQAEDAVLLDTSKLNPDEVIEAIRRIAFDRAKLRGVSL